MAAVARHRAAVGEFEQGAQVAAREGSGEGALDIAALAIGHQPVGVIAHVVDGPLKDRTLEGDDVARGDFFLRPRGKGIDRKRLDILHIGIEVLERVAAHRAVGPGVEAGHEGAVKEPETAGGELLRQGGVDLLPDEGLPGGGVIPAARDRFAHPVFGEDEILRVGGVDLFEDAPVGYHGGLVVAEALGRPDGAGLAARFFPLRADAKNLEDPYLSRVADGEGFAAVA